MRHTAKPFAVEIRKSRNSSTNTPRSRVAATGALAPRFLEAEKLFRAPSTPARENDAVLTARPMTILPDLSVPKLPLVTAETQRPRGPRQEKKAPAGPPARVRSSRRPEVSADGALRTEVNKREAPIAGRLLPRTTTRPEPTELPLKAKPAAPRFRDPRPGRGEFLPGQRWKRRLAPILR